jgi:hypothetical protein
LKLSRRTRRACIQGHGTKRRIVRANTAAAGRRRQPGSIAKHADRTWCACGGPCSSGGK